MAGWKREGTPVARIGSTRVWVWEGDIAELDVQAVVNAANNAGWMGSGVAGALKRAGGDEVEREAMAKGPWPVGESVVTTAGRLSAHRVIHAAVMGQDLVTDAHRIRRATRSSLAAAEEEKLVSVALPAFGTGVGGFALADAAREMGEALKTHLLTTPDSCLEDVVFAVFGEQARSAFISVLGEILS
ncbi:MAG: macro domain-containing protein [Actinomycetota bacterium]